MARRQTGKAAQMFSLHKATRSALVAGLIVILGIGSASAADMTIGKEATINLTGKVNSQVALALGSNAMAHNVAGGITGVGGLSIGDKANITAKGQANSQVALALGSGASAANNVGGVLAIAH